MASSFERVRPGDVITSDLINRLISRIEELEQGSGTTPGTTFDFRFDPVLQQAVGQALTLRGTFDFPLSMNTIRIDTLQIPTSDFLAGSDATSISFMIPNSIAVTGASKPVTVSVQTTTKGQRSKPYVLTPEVQSEVPNPTIASVTNFDNTTPGALLQVGARASINGDNLSPDPTIIFRVQTGPGAFVDHPAPGLDRVNSTARRLVVTVPLIPENSQGDIPVIVEVTIPGAINKASRTAMLMGG